MVVNMLSNEYLRERLIQMEDKREVLNESVYKNIFRYNTEVSRTAEEYLRNIFSFRIQLNQCSVIKTQTITLIGTCRVSTIIILISSFDGMTLGCSSVYGSPKS